MLTCLAAMVRYRKKLKAPIRLADLISSRTKRWRVQKLKRLEIIRQKWVQAAGDFVAKHAVPVRLVRKTLRVGVDDSSWVNEMSYLTDTILQRLQELLPGKWVDEIQTVVVESLTETESAKDTRPPVMLSEATDEMNQRVNETLKDVSQPGLATVIKRAMLTSLRRPIQNPALEKDADPEPGVDDQQDNAVEIE
ncbi:MAG: DUF721 domain-containing protein [Deltaproteobacteria bacterium]|nr:DUF721 domain-containing protein [Deltaproteobacteria bacterium]